MTETWTTEQEWTRVNQVMELVKQEGDANCEAAFDFLRSQLAAATRFWNHIQIWEQQPHIRLFQ